MNSRHTLRLAALGLLSWLAVPGMARPAPASDYELAKELQNPVADLISVPLENRLDRGPGSTSRYTLNVQPVLPFSIGKGWTVISRTILPVIHAESPVPGGKALTGLGDVSQSFFLSPAEPVGGWTVGVGPMLVLPTASERELGRGIWGAGPTGVALRGDGPWTYGALLGHAWRLAGRSGSGLSATSLQPFVAYTMESLMTLGGGSETSYDWIDRQWLVPVDVNVSQLFVLGKTPVELGLGGRYYAVRPTGGPDWAVKVTIALTFPK